MNFEKSIEFSDLVGLIIGVFELTLYLEGNNGVGFNGEDVWEGLGTRGTDWDPNRVETLLPHHMDEFALGVITALLHGTDLFSG
jgi:hypothetical protein